MDGWMFSVRQHVTCPMSLCVIQRVLLRTVKIVQVVSARVLHAVLATIALHQLNAAVRYFCSFTLRLVYITTKQAYSLLLEYNHVKHI